MDSFSEETNQLISVLCGYEYTKIVELNIDRSMLEEIIYSMKEYVELYDYGEILERTDYKERVSRNKKIYLYMYKDYNGLDLGNNYKMKDNNYINVVNQESNFSLLNFSHELIHQLQDQVFINSNIGYNECRLVGPLNNWKEEMAYSIEKNVERIVNKYYDEDKILKSNDTAKILGKDDYSKINIFDKLYDDIDFDVNNSEPILKNESEFDAYMREREM